MSFKMHTGFCWVGTIAVAVMAFCLTIMQFDTPFHRVLIGGTTAFVVFLNGNLPSRKRGALYFELDFSIFR